MVHIVPYNAEWPMDFLHEKRRLEEALKESSVKFEHIGSTSISGMQAKPMIDIMIGIENYPPASEWIDKLCSLGYTFYGEAGVPQRLYILQNEERKITTWWSCYCMAAIGNITSN